MTEQTAEGPESYHGYSVGNTAYEEASGETLAQRPAQEEPEPDPFRSVQTAEGTRIGGVRAGASAEEAAMHVIESESWFDSP